MCVNLLFRLLIWKNIHVLPETSRPCKSIPSLCLRFAIDKYLLNIYLFVSTAGCILETRGLRSLIILKSLGPVATGQYPQISVSEAQSIFGEKMTDVNANDEGENKFSFRMFDLYRRFVEILRQNSNYLEEFKSGYPSQVTCVDVIKKAFLHRQKQDTIAHYLKYLSTNAKFIADHAENLPHNWTDAIKYTDQCIKLIKKYLRSRSINYKKDFDANSLVKEISEYLYTNPNKVQLEAVTDYLKYDLQNPKKTIVPNNKTAKIKKKSKKSSETMQIDINDSIEVALEVIFNESIKSDSNDDSQDVLQQKIRDNGEKILQKKSFTSTNKSLNVEETKSLSEKTLQKEMNDESKEKCSLEDKEMKDDNIELPIYENLETDEESFIDVINESPLTCKGLKRYTHDTGHDYEHIKKICISKDCSQQDLQEDQNQPLNYNKNDKSCEDEIEISILDVPKKKFTVIDVEEDNSYQINSSKDLLNILEDVQDEENEENTSINFDKRTLRLKENSCSSSGQNYLNPISMTYYDAYKLMETITNFCDLKTEIPLEELLILRRTKDLMLWKSLKDIKKEKENT